MHPEARVDYIELFDPATPALVEEVRPGTHLALAVFVAQDSLITRDCKV
jgi:hypothetical protein